MFHGTCENCGAQLDLDPVTPPKSFAPSPDPEAASTTLAQLEERRKRLLASLQFTEQK
jgi:hypothetical protein